MKILIPTDGSRFSKAALRMVVAQNRPQNTRLRVLHVTEPILPFYPPDYSAGDTSSVPELVFIQKERLKQAKKLVVSTAEKLRAAGFKVDTAVVEGHARTEIVTMAAKWRADLIVVGSHGWKGLDRFLIGSVSEYVARHALCSVEIVRIRTRKAGT